MSTDEALQRPPVITIKLCVYDGYSFKVGSSYVLTDGGGDCIFGLYFSPLHVFFFMSVVVSNEVVILRYFT